MESTVRNEVKFTVMALCVLLALTLDVQARAQTQSGVLNRALHLLPGVGGYWFTSDSANHALGSPKFSGNSQYYVKPARWNNMPLTGGVEMFGASDHWFVGGGNDFSLTGLSFQLSGDKGRLNRLSPFINGGVFLGHVRSEILGFRETKVVPSMTIGAEIKVHRYVTLTGRYRFSGSIHDINLDGYSLGIKVF